MKVYGSIFELVGKTPIAELKKIEKRLKLKAKLLVKLECFNPAGSVKDRAARRMIEDAEASGRLKIGATVIEPTSGNTGIGLCALAAERGYKSIVVMPENMSLERRKLMAAYGAKVVLTPKEEGMTGAIKKAEQLAKETGGVVMGQFVNPSNPAAHYETTGPEIYDDTDGQVDCFVAGVGTGGTITGTGRYLKENKPSIKIVAVEPSGSPTLSCGEKGAHMIQGIGAGFVPEIFDRSVVDEIITVSDSDAASYGRLIAREEGFLVGISSGAALAAAVSLARREELAEKTIVALLPDTGERYLSSEFYFPSEDTTPN